MMMTVRIIVSASIVADRPGVNADGPIPGSEADFGN